MTTALADDQTLAQLLACVEDGDDTALAAGVDYLQEMGAQLADVLLWYAHPPDWLRPWHAQDEAARRMLASYLRWTETKTPAVWGAWPGKVGVLRWDLVWRSSLNWQKLAHQCNTLDPGGSIVVSERINDLQRVMRRDGEPYPWALEIVGAGRRDLKRTVLGLFPEVVAPLRFPGRQLRYVKRADDVMELTLDGNKFLSTPDAPIRIEWAQKPRYSSVVLHVPTPAPLWISEPVTLPPLSPLILHEMFRQQGVDHCVGRPHFIAPARASVDCSCQHFEDAGVQGSQPLEVALTMHAIPMGRLVWVDEESRRWHYWHGCCPACGTLYWSVELASS